MEIGDLIDYNMYHMGVRLTFVACILFNTFFKWTPGTLVVDKITTNGDPNKTTKLQMYLNVDVFKFSVSQKSSALRKPEHMSVLEKCIYSLFNCIQVTSMILSILRLCSSPENRSTQSKIKHICEMK